MTQISRVYIRTHRIKSGLTQRELAIVLGYSADVQVSRHERANKLPSLSVAIGYEILFRVPASQLFPDLYARVEEGIEERLAEMEAALQQKSAKGRDTYAIARKLEWIYERKNLMRI